MRKQLKAVIFDLDGTLIDSEEFCYLGWVSALSEYYVEFSNTDYMRYVGKSGRQIGVELVSDYKLQISGDELLAKRNVVFEKLCSEKEPKIMHYALEAVDYFVNKGFLMGMATSDWKDRTIVKTRDTGILERFGFTRFADDVTKRKPDPEVYVSLLEEMGVDPSECIVFEDTPAGVEAAIGAGIGIVIAVPNEYTKTLNFSKASYIALDLEKAILYAESHFYFSNV